MARSNTGSSANYLSNTSAVVTILPITIAGWYKSASLTTAQSICILGSSPSNDYVNLEFDGSNSYGHGPGKLLADPGGATNESYSIATIADTTTWHHCCAVFTSSTSRTVYLDGVAGTSSSVSIPLVTPTTTYLGIFPPSFSVLNGAISDVSIWNIALTQDEISSLAGSGGGTGAALPSTVATGNLIAYWQLTGTSPEQNLVTGGAFPLTVTGSMPYVAGPLTYILSLTAGTCSASIVSSTSISVASTACTGGTATFSYQFRSSLDGTTWSNLGTQQTGLAQGIAPTSVTQSSLSAGTYYYDCVVTDSTSTNATSNTASTTIATLTPGTCLATRNTNTSILISGTACSGGVAPYTYQFRSSPDGSTWSNFGSAQYGVGIGTSPSSIIDTGLTSGNTYYFDYQVTDFVSTLATSGSTSLLLTALYPSTYYVSPTGSDSNNGTSSGTPWQTIAKVNAHMCVPGDSILFQGGQTFSGNILITGITATPQTPFILGSYGTGNAIISCGSSYGIRVSGCSGVKVSNFTITGAGVTSGGVSSSNNSGVEIQNPLTTNNQLSSIYIDNINISSCYGGIEVRGHSTAISGPCSGFKDIRISNCTISSCCSWGIFVRSIPLLSYSGSTMTVASYNLAIPTTFPNQSNNNFLIFKGTPTSIVYISDCQCYNIYGDITWTSTYNCHTGDGIMVHSAINAIVERCQVWNCGQSGYGPAGIWFQETTNGLARYCIVVNQQSGQGTGVDGDGYDADGGCINCTWESCIAWGCNNAGFLAGPYTGALVPTGTLIRNCISISNVRSGSSSYGEVTPYGGANMNVVNCTFYLTGSSDFCYTDALGGSVNLINCIVLGTGQSLVSFNSGTASTCLNNIWYTISGTFQMAYGGTTYNTFSTWQAASGMEIVNGVVLGKNVNPQLNNPISTVPTMPNASYTITNFDLTSGSPAIGAGINSLVYYSSSSDPGKIDFHGYPNCSQLNVSDTGYDIGAIKYNGSSVLPLPITTVDVSRHKIGVYS